MFSSIVWPSWGELFHGEITFSRIGEIASSMFTELVEHEYFVALRSGITASLERFVLPIFILLAVLSAVFSAFGRKLLPVAKILTFFSVGFIFGVSFVAPYLTGVSLNIAPWIVGAVIGVVLALLSKSLYFVLYIVAFAYSSYMIFMGGQLLPESIVSFTKDNMILSLFAVCVTIVLIILLRKPIEIIGTAVLGGYLFSLCMERVLYEALALPRIAAVSIILMILVAFLGVIKQFKGKRGGKAKKIKKAKKTPKSEKA
ncbi:MAG: hypothetical protein IJW66_03260 [Clostridia bacterium]|nr:hypothetical protein [Clostridia bacterium]